jgi:hypothetical protein
VEVQVGDPDIVTVEAELPAQLDGEDLRATPLWLLNDLKNPHCALCGSVM